MSEEEMSTEQFMTKFNQPKHSYVEIQKFTSNYYKDLTLEKNVIQQAFQSNNYTYIRKLPLNFKPQTILDERLKRVEQQLLQEKEGRQKTYQQKYQSHQEAIKEKKMEQIGSMGYFEAFTYTGEEYDTAKELANIKRSNDQMARRKISDLDFRPSDIDYKGKYQDPFQYRDKADPKIKNTPNYLFPFHNISANTYDSFHQSQVRKQLNHKAESLAGPFLPSMKQKSLSKIHRSMLNQILQDIEIFLQKHLKKTPYILAVTIKDHIQLLFSEQFKEDLKLKTVMSMICQNPSLQKYLLKREVNRWGIVDNSYILFTMIPPWIAYSGKGSQASGSTAEITRILNQLDRQSGLKNQ